MSQHNHEHSHERPGSGHQHDIIVLSGWKIFWVTLLNAVITAAEVVGGIVSGSLALL